MNFLFFFSDGTTFTQPDGTAIDLCQRQAFRAKCPDMLNPGEEVRSQFVLRYYLNVRRQECVSYPFGHCKGDPSEPPLYRYKEACESACLNPNAGESILAGPGAPIRRPGELLPPGAQRKEELGIFDSFVPSAPQPPPPSAVPAGPSRQPNSVSSSQPKSSKKFCFNFLLSIYA